MLCDLYYFLFHTKYFILSLRRSQMSDFRIKYK